MKKIFFVVFFSFVMTMVNFAQTVEKTYYFDNPTFEKVNGYDLISFANTYNNGKTGEATLPWQTVSLLLPQNTEAQSIIVEFSDFVKIEGTYNLLPRQQARPLSSTEPLTFVVDENFYKSEEVYPKTDNNRVNTQYLNGCSFAFAQFSPVRYVPATGEISYARSATVKVSVTASRTDKSNLLWMTPEIQGRVERLAQNPDAMRDYKTRSRSMGGYELLVITPQDWVPYFDEYVDFYEARGLRTRVTALETIYANFDGRDDAERVREYIKQEYENEGIMMVLLGGDSGIVPWRALYCYVSDDTQDNLPADMYFACLDGSWDDNNNGIWGEIGEDDLLPELAVGRMPFNNEQQFNNMMHKTLEYQSNPVLGEFRDVILGAEHLGDGYYGSNDLNMLIGGSSNFDYTTVGIPAEYDFHKIYADGETGWSGGIFRNAINNYGGQYVHHVGHANTDYVAGWYVSSTNDNSFAKLDGVNHNYNFFHSHGCICGDFTHTCILERMVNISTGFVATTGNSRYGWYVPWGDGMAAHLHREFVDAYYNDRLPYIGTAFVEMKIMTAPYVVTSWGDSGAMRWNIYDINILGDVAVCPWLDEPFRPEIEYAAALPMGITNTSVIINKLGVAQSNFRCSIFHNGELLAFGMTDANGVANVTFAEALNVADTLQLIVTGPNAIPQTINIIGVNSNAAFVYPQSTDIHGEFLFGSDISMDVDFTNAGLIDANNVTASLSTDSEYVALSKSTINIGNINAGQTVTIADAFEFEVADNIPDGIYVDFVVTCSDGNNMWNKNIFFTSFAPVLNINEMTYVEVDGDMNGFIDPGETVKITVSGKNVGHYAAINPYLHIDVDSQYVTIVDNDINLDDVNIGDTFEEEIYFIVSDNVPEGTPVVITANMIYGQYVENHDIKLCVGTVMETFETADFSHLSWQHAGDANWYITDSQANTGTYSARNGDISSNQISSLIVKIENMSDGTINFYFKTDTRYKRDYLVFYVDGSVEGLWSGENDWTFASFDVSAGEHTLEWRYDTAPNGGTNGNTCWIDDIAFHANTMIINDVAEIHEKELAVYPNPADDFIFLKGEDIQYIEIFNSIGMKVVSRNVNCSESMINVSELASGVYFVRTKDRDGYTSTVKIIKR